MASPAARRKQHEIARRALGNSPIKATRYPDRSPHAMTNAAAAKSATQRAKAKDDKHRCHLLQLAGPHDDEAGVMSYLNVKGGRRWANARLRSLTPEQGASQAEKDSAAASAAVTTLLHEAAIWGSAGVVRALLEAGANANALDSAGRSPLLCCILGPVSAAARMKPDPEASNRSIRETHGIGPSARDAEVAAGGLASPQRNGIPALEGSKSTAGWGSGSTDPEAATIGLLRPELRMTVANLGKDGHNVPGIPLGYPLDPRASAEAAGAQRRLRARRLEVARMLLACGAEALTVDALDRTPGDVARARGDMEVVALLAPHAMVEMTGHHGLAASVTAVSKDSSRRTSTAMSAAPGSSQLPPVLSFDRKTVARAAESARAHNKYRPRPIRPLRDIDERLGRYGADSLPSSFGGSVSSSRKPSGVYSSGIGGAGGGYGRDSRTSHGSDVSPSAATDAPIGESVSVAGASVVEKSQRRAQAALARERAIAAAEAGGFGQQYPASARRGLHRRSESTGSLFHGAAGRARALADRPRKLNANAATLAALRNVLAKERKY